MRKAVVAVLSVQVALTLAFLLTLRSGRFPLGIPGEWEWLRLPHGVAPMALQWAIGVSGVLGYALFAGWGMRVLGTTPHRWNEVMAVLGLVVASLVTQVLVAIAAPEGYGLAKWILALHNPGSNGYYTVAKKQMGDLAPFLADYPNWIQRQDALHVGTHPPGLFLLQRGLLNAMEAQPAVARFVVEHLPQSVSSACLVVEQYAHLTRADRATLALTGALTMLLCSLTVVPLYLLARSSLPANAAWAAATLWPLVPSAILFQPAADTAFPFLSTTALAFAAYSSRANKPRASLIAAAGSGVVLAVGMGFTLAFLPIGLIVAILIGIGIGPGRSLRQKGGAIVVVGLGFLIPTLLGWAVTRSNPFLTWWWNQRNHARFYVEYPRSYLAWIIANPLELAVAIGLPAAVWVLVGIGRLRQAPRVSLATFALLAVLTLGGRSLSEVARLWLPMMPALLVAAGAGLTRLGGGAASLGITVGGIGIQTLILQATIQVVYPT
ncbi:Dolichyl-phosphate-mannose-protein mannosyltransferase [Singulisphaera sp. GP187]|uniref:glycosyltransferase family 39 protein n=1 Tax=Singulisphaera sp. GP187 TaxID=1882752 RepID=UPI0009260C4A|nr:glycosyltransferase family 39 protein [Singulisphaera sp. GP187]SIN84895.1 Dolichyl-phosphate-mannose-protein mannosyltransferase [Singulisphaera sp. GP187]